MAVVVLNIAVENAKEVAAAGEQEMVQACPTNDQTIRTSNRTTARDGAP